MAATPERTPMYRTTTMLPYLHQNDEAKIYVLPPGPFEPDVDCALGETDIVTGTLTVDQYWDTEIAALVTSPGEEFYLWVTGAMLCDTTRVGVR